MGETQAYAGGVMPHIVLQPLAQEDAGFSADQFASVTANVQAPQALVVSAQNPAFEDFESWAAELEANPGEPTSARRRSTTSAT